MDVKIDEIVKQVIKEVQNGASGNDTVKDVYSFGRMPGFSRKERGLS